MCVTPGAVSHLTTPPDSSANRFCSANSSPNEEKQVVTTEAKYLMSLTSMPCAEKQGLSAHCQVSMQSHGRVLHAGFVLHALTPGASAFGSAHSNNHRKSFPVGMVALASGLPAYWVCIVNVSDFWSGLCL